MKWRMTYNNKNFSGCSTRGIAVRESKEELIALRERLKKNIYNVRIEEVKAPEPTAGK